MALQVNNNKTIESKQGENISNVFFWLEFSSSKDKVIVSLLPYLSTSAYLTNKSPLFLNIESTYTYTYDRSVDGQIDVVTYANNFVKNELINLLGWTNEDITIIL